MNYRNNKLVGMEISLWHRHFYKFIACLLIAYTSTYNNFVEEKRKTKQLLNGSTK